MARHVHSADARWCAGHIRATKHRTKAFAAGARGYVLKGNPRDLPVAIRRVLDGELHLSDGLRRKLDYDPTVYSGPGAKGA